MNIKFQTNNSEFFKEWKYGDLRILRDVKAKTLYPYRVDKFNGKTWDTIGNYQTLGDSKKVVAELIEE